MITAPHVAVICVYMSDKQKWTQGWAKKLHGKLYTNLSSSHMDYGHAMEQIGRERA